MSTNNTSEAVFDEHGKVIGYNTKQGKLVWTCDQYKCTWTNPVISGAVKKKKNRLEQDKSVSDLYGGLR